MTPGEMLGTDWLSFSWLRRTDITQILEVWGTRVLPGFFRKGYELKKKLDDLIDQEEFKYSYFVEKKSAVEPMRRSILANWRPVHVIPPESEPVSWEQFNKNATFGRTFYWHTFVKITREKIFYNCMPHSNWHLESVVGVWIAYVYSINVLQKCTEWV